VTAVENVRACGHCLARTWLIARLSGHLENARGAIQTVLALDDDELIDALAGRDRTELGRALDRFDPADARARALNAGLEVICRCDANYPAALYELEAPPAVLHIAGSFDRFLELIACDPVAVVGARRASDYGTTVAHSLGRGLSASGLTVLSGMAFGIDSGAHAGALEAGGNTVAVLPGSPDRPYPRGKRALWRRIRAHGAAVSELPPGSAVWRWMFPARNRIIAALARMTVVVEASKRSGALLTAGIALGLGRPVGAVPGRVTAPMAAGANGLIASGAHVIQGPQDVLDALFGDGVRKAVARERPQLDGGRALLLAALADGMDTERAFARAGMSVADGLATLGELELGGYVRREPGGRFSVAA
jgi:DNA processing protein